MQHVLGDMMVEPPRPAVAGGLMMVEHHRELGEIALPEVLPPQPGGVRIVEDYVELYGDEDER